MKNERKTKLCEKIKYELISETKFNRKTHIYKYIIDPKN